MSKFRDDTGMSLVELIVAAVIGAVILGLLSVIFANNLMVTGEAQAANTRADRLNVILATIEESAKNSLAIRQIDGHGDNKTEVTMMVHRPEDPDGVYVCRKWEADTGGGDLGILHSSLSYAEWAPGDTPPTPKVLLDAVAMHAYAINHTTRGTPTGWVERDFVLEYGESVVLNVTTQNFLGPAAKDIQSLQYHQSRVAIMPQYKYSAPPSDSYDDSVGCWDVINHE